MIGKLFERHLNSKSSIEALHYLLKYSSEDNIESLNEHLTKYGIIPSLEKFIEVMDPDSATTTLKVIDLLTPSLHEEIFTSKTILSDLILKECLSCSQDHRLAIESLEITLSLLMHLSKDSFTSLIFDHHLMDTLVDYLDGSTN